MSFATVVQRLQTLENPYPGLRPFEIQESHLFFGRDRQVAELVGRLERNRFVAVLGVSGSGKSSLVRAGLIPALERGRVLDAGRDWRMVVTRPAGAPFENLAVELRNRGLDPSALKTSSHGLIDIARQLSVDESLLVVIDQFEELFRYKDVVPTTEAIRRRRDESAADAAEFVQLILATSRSYPPVYVVLTMRSDYLGDCAEFRDLPETLNDCQYLVPRMTRDQRKEAIELPLGRVEIAPNLVQRLLNDAGDEPDQLPILQHALMRTWNHWRSTDPNQKRRIELDDYEAIGAFGGALNQHADELLATVPQHLAAAIFKRLTARGPGNRERRNPATLAELWGVCGATSEEQRGLVTSVVDHFRLGEATFLTPRDGAIDAIAYLDITHESLIRQWKRLRDEWLPDEQRSAKTFLDLVVRARNWKEKRGEVLIGLDFADARAWDRQRNKSDAWAEHYADKTELDTVVEFIHASDEKERRRQMQARRKVWFAGAISSVFAGLAVLAFVQMKEADRQRNEADRLRSNSVVRQLVAQSVALQSEQIDLELPVILAIESMSRSSSLEGDRALRESAGRLPRVLSRVLHDGPVNAVVFSPDGRLVASAGEDTSVRVFDVASGRIMLRLPHDKPVTSLAFSPDGRWVATGSDDNSARLFDSSSGTQGGHLEHDGSVASIAFSPDGSRVATGSDDMTVRVIDAVSWKEVWRHAHGGPVNSVAFSADGRHVATGSGDMTARVFDAVGGREVSRLLHQGAVRSVSMSADGRRVATGSDDKTARVFDAGTGREISQLTHKGAVWSVAFSADGRRVATGSDDKTARVFDASSGNEVSRLTTREPVESVAFSRDGRRVAVGSDDRTARVFDAASGREIARLTHTGAVATVAFSADGNRVASGSLDGTARVFDVIDGREIMRLTLQGSVRSVALSPDAHSVAIGSSDETAQVFDAISGKRLLALAHQGSVGSVAFSANGRWVAVGSSNGNAQVFDVASGRSISQPLTHDGPVASVSFSADGRRLVTGSFDRTARVFDTTNWKEISRLQHDDIVTSALFNANGLRVATASEDMTARVFDAGNGNELSRLVHVGPVDWAAFSPDGQRLVTGSEDSYARVFDLAKRDENTVTLMHQNAVRFVVFNPDGRRVASGSDDMTARVFDAHTGQEIARMTLDGRVLEARFVERDRYLITLSLATSDAIADNEVVLTRHLLNPQNLIEDACARLTHNLDEASWKQYVGIEIPFHRTCSNLP